MSDSLHLLVLTAASIGFIHTVIGPDHYVPFIMMSGAQRWSRMKTLWVTMLCGVGHVASSVVLGFIGVAFGVALQRLEIVESVRGEIAAWALIAFGTLYMAWGLRHASRASMHTHVHEHTDGTVHAHTHTHIFGRRAAKSETHHADKRVFTTWALFTVFVLGPCEPLIPILMYPAALHSLPGLVLVTSVFAVVTIGTMVGMVLLVSRGMHLISFRLIEKYTHAIAGGVIAVSGLMIQMFGL
jgi:nickel/cobalt transporter (NicO) family protein